MRKRERIFWACLVQVGEVDVFAVLSIFFLNHHYIGQPIGVFNFDDRSDVDELLDFFVDDLIFFLCELPSLLLHQRMSWIYSELMSDYRWIDPIHVFMCPCGVIFMLD